MCEGCDGLPSRAALQIDQQTRHQIKQKLPSEERQGHRRRSPVCPEGAGNLSAFEVPGIAPDASHDRETAILGRIFIALMLRI